MPKKINSKIELTEEEIHHLYAMIHLAGFREKRELSPFSRMNRTDMQKIMGRILKKLRKAEHFTAD